MLHCSVHVSAFILCYLKGKVCCPSASSSCLGAQAGELTSVSPGPALGTHWTAGLLPCSGAAPLGGPCSLSGLCCPSADAALGLGRRVPAPQGPRVPGLSLGVQCAAGQTLLHAAAFCAWARVCANGCFRDLLSSGICPFVPLTFTYNLSSKIKVLRSSRQQQRRADQAWALCSAGAEWRHSQAADAGDLPGLHKPLGSFLEGNREPVEVLSRKWHEVLHLQPQVCVSH